MDVDEDNGRSMNSSTVKSIEKVEKKTIWELRCLNYC